MEIEEITLIDLPKVASLLLDFAGNEKIIIFTGEMGAGKTTFVKSVCEALGVKDVVSSPTYAIVNEYGSENGSVYHFDFYRIKSVEEAFDIGYEEYFYGGGISLIEWPEKIEEILPDHYIKVEILVQSENQRHFKFSKI